MNNDTSHIELSAAGDLASRLFPLPLCVFPFPLGYRLMIGYRGKVKGLGVAVRVFFMSNSSSLEDSCFDLGGVYILGSTPAGLEQGAPPFSSWFYLNEGLQTPRPGIR